MSLALTLNNALSGLKVNQSALQVTSNNVANVNTPGYTRKSVEQQTRVLAGLGAGAMIQSVSRSVDQYLQRDIRTESASLGALRVKDDFYRQMQNLFGNQADNNSVSATITGLSKALEGLAAAPESAASRLDTVNAGESLARELNRLAAQIQDLRTQADQEIATVVGAVNRNLSNIADLNLKIATNIGKGVPVADLQDQRALALDELSGYLDIQYFERSSGEMVVMTKDGRSLVEAQASTLMYQPATVMTAEREYVAPGNPAYPGDVAGIILNPSDPPDAASDGARDLTLSLNSGELAALIEMRDRTLSGLGYQFDELAARLRDEVNAIHNQGAAYPGAQVLEGTTRIPDMMQGVSGAPLAATGSTRIVSFNPDGSEAGHVTLHFTTGTDTANDIFLGTNPSVQDIINAINGAAGLSATLTDNKLRIQGDSMDQTIAIDEMDSAIANAGDSRGFSHFFGLNNFFHSSPSYADYTSATVNAATRSTTAGTLTFNVDGQSAPITVNYGAAMTLDQIAGLINAGTSGTIRAEVTEVDGGVRLQMRGNAGIDFFVNDSGSLLSGLEVRAGVFDAAGGLTVNQALSESPDLVARGKLRHDGTQYYLGSADDELVRDLAAKFAENMQFSAVGGMPASETTLAGFASSIITFNATGAANASSEYGYQETLHANLTDKAMSISGVNLDEELSNMIVYQSAYQAAARLVQATSDMYDILASLGR